MVMLVPSINLQQWGWSGGGGLSGHRGQHSGAPTPNPPVRVSSLPGTSLAASGSLKGGVTDENNSQKLSLIYEMRHF